MSTTTCKYWGKLRQAHEARRPPRMCPMTAAATQHTPESIDRDIRELGAICLKLRDMAEVYNGMRAGARLRDAAGQVARAISRLDMDKIALAQGGAR